MRQVAYQVGHLTIAKEACSVLWEHFVAKPPPLDNVTYTTSSQSDFQLQLHRYLWKLIKMPIKKQYCRQLEGEMGYKDE